MKKIFKNAMLLMAACTMGFGMTSCSDDDNATPNTSIAQTSDMQDLVENYVYNIVNPTYTHLAESTEKLQKACDNMNKKRHAGTLVQADIDRACEAFKTARRYWEQSESFLYGAASDNEIDPHIDSWPLDRSQLEKALNSADIIAGINGEQPDKFVYKENANFESVIGFHGLEFVLFRNGANRTEASMNAEYETDKGLTSVKTIDECAFAAAVAGDLRNMTSLLAYGWMGTNVNATISNVLKAAPWVLEGTGHAGLSSKGVTYDEAITKTGTANAMFPTWQQTLQNIFVGGCSNICQEVYTQKLGQAYRVATGKAEEEDAGDYIESPYSKRSFQDYQDNIYSIQHSLYGTLENDPAQAAEKSLMTFMQKNKYERLAQLTSAMQKAISVLEKAKKSGKAFVDAPGDSQVKECIDAVQALDEELNQAGTWVNRLQAQ